MEPIPYVNSKHASKDNISGPKGVKKKKETTLPNSSNYTNKVSNPLHKEHNKMAHNSYYAALIEISVHIKHCVECHGNY